MTEHDQGDKPGIGSAEPVGFEQLYRQHYSYVRSYFRERVRLEEVDELTQETFLNAYRGRGRFRGDAHDTTWLSVIAKNVFTNYVRDRNALKRDGIEVSIDPVPHSREEHQPLDPESPDPNALDGALDDERIDLLRQAVAALPSRTRQIMRLAFVHGLKYREVARTLEISVNTVKSSVFKGKQKLKDFIQDRAPEVDLDLGDDDE